MSIGARSLWTAARLLLVSAALALPAHGVVIRHDRTDADALALGRPCEAVGRVLPDGGCTLIAPTWAVTAAHVAASVAPGDSVRFGGRAFVIARTVLHPQGTEREGAPPEVDLALLQLATPVAGIDPIPLYTGEGELGQTLTIVGYGDYGTPETGLRRTDGQRRAVTNIVDDAGPLRLFLRFDEPPGGTDLEGVGGPGDSGGPALIQVRGTWYVAGISSASMNGKPGRYGVTDVYTRVRSHLAWIAEAMK